MLRVGITGGIGSGKSVVCRVLLTLGIPVFSADEAARYLQETDQHLKEQIQALLGEQAYRNGLPDRDFISSRVFNDAALLQQLNDLVHPATVRFGREWFDVQHTPYAIKEAAIFFESGTNSSMDVMVGVFAPPELRIQRAMKRGGWTREKVTGIMARQMNEDEKMRRCDHVVRNDDTTALIPQVLALHKQLLATAAGGNRA